MQVCHLYWYTPSHVHGSKACSEEVRPQLDDARQLPSHSTLARGFHSSARNALWSVASHYMVSLSVARNGRLWFCCAVFV
eukprot:10472901-Alexandrium_andersonii.AAC.1